MSTQDTPRLGMPLLQPAQAQKHVTVNESLMRLDGLVNLVLNSLTRTAPPEATMDGQCWAVPAGATGAWAGQEGRIAIAANNGWVFAYPRHGMRCFVTDLGRPAIHDGEAWVPGAMSVGAFGSGLIAGGSEAEVDIGPGASFDTGVMIPPGVMVIGVVSRVTTAITGTLTSWSMGNAGATDRFGSGLGLSEGSWARGLLGSPMSYYSPEALIMTAAGGNFAGGRLRVGLHWLELQLPRA